MEAVVKPVLMLLASLVLVVMVFLSGVIITANVIAEPEPHRFANLDTPDLWTSKPKPVDASKQTYERIEPALPAATDTASAATDNDAAAIQNASAPANNNQMPNAIDATTTASVQPDMDVANTADMLPIEEQQQPMISSAQAQWCYARYRSYRVEDNTYQPYGGGPRRQCKAPGSVATSVANDNVAAVSNQRSQQRQSVAPAQEEYVRDPDIDIGYDEPVDNQQPQYADSATVGAHLEWCFNRYRSYRVEDNSYQPSGGGPRRECRSPY